MAERNRIAEIHGCLLEAEEALSSQPWTAVGRELIWQELRADVLERVASIVLEREELSKWLQVTAATLFSERHQRRKDEAEDEDHMKWLRSEIRARNDELTVLESVIYRQQETIEALRGNR